MAGWVTEKHLDEADEAFPGIKGFWEELPVDARPKTFLDLIVMFDRRGDA